VRIDALSNQTKFATLEKRQGDASELVASHLADLDKLFNVTVDQNSVSATLVENAEGVGVLQGRLSISYNNAILAEFNQLYDTFATYQDDVQLPLAHSVTWGSSYISPSMDSVIFYICEANVMRQLTGCHGEHVKRLAIDHITRSAESTNDFMVTRFELLSGNEELGTVNVPVIFNCLSNLLGQTRQLYLEGAYPADYYSFQGFAQIAVNTIKSTQAPVIAVTAVPIGSGKPMQKPASAPQEGALCGFAPGGANGGDSYRVVIPPTTAPPIIRYFSLYAPRHLIERIDGMRVSIGWAASPRQ
jgi:hypothetical protein